MRYVFVVNPVSGKGKHLSATRTRIEAACGEAGITPEILVTEKAGDAVDFARKAAEPGDPVTVFACGGDGTMNEVLNGIYGYENATLGILPVGSGNDFIKSFHDYDTFEDLSRQLSGETVSVDVMQSNGRCCLNIANIGFDCEVCRKGSDYKKLPLISGIGAYTLAIVSTLLSKIGEKLTLIFPSGEEIHWDAFLMAMCNGVCYGGGYYAGSHAVLTDGMLEILSVRHVPLRKFLKYVGPYKSGKALGNPGLVEDILHRRAPWVEIRGTHPLCICLDGECITQGEKIRVAIAEKKISLLVPKGIKPLNTSYPAEFACPGV